MSAVDDRFTLEVGRWYGLTMFPGYGDAPYHSPIRVDHLEAVGERRFDLAFLNLGYADGIQNFQKRFRTLRRTSSHMLAAETEVDDRTYVITGLTRRWMQTHFPALADRRPDLFDSSGNPVQSAFLTLAD